MTAPVTAGFAYANLKPKRLTGAYEYTHEAAASVADLEGALRRDLADAIKSKMSDTIINGVAPTTQNPQNIEGFLTAVTATDLGSAEADAAAYGRLHALGVDGIHASMETEVMSVIGDEPPISTRRSCTLPGAVKAGSRTVKPTLRRVHGLNVYSGDCQQETNGDLAQCRTERRRGDEGRFVAALWPTLEVVRDSVHQGKRKVSC